MALMQRRAVLRYLSLWGTGFAFSRRIPLLHAAEAKIPGMVFNQIGYPPKSEKIITVQASILRDSSFDVYSDQTGSKVMDGRLTAAALDAA